MKSSVQLLERGVLLLLAALVVALPSASRAADVLSYGTIKMQLFDQTSTATPTLEAYGFIAFVDMDTACGQFVTNATVKLADGSVSDLFSDGGSWNWSEVFLDQASLDATYPNGTNRMNIYAARDGLKTNLSLIVTGNGYPVTTPRISNFTAAQSVDAANSFTVTWDAWAGGTVTDYVQLQLSDANDTAVFETARYGYPGALKGTNTFLVIPVNTLSPGQTYSGVLLFGRGVSNTTDYAGAVGVGAYAKRTEFLLQTTGSPDTSAPSLWDQKPFNGETNVPLNCPIGFTFSEPMRSGHSISWSGNADPCNFIYTWSSDKQSFICIYKTNWPANAVISWTIDPTNGFDSFQDLAGNSLDFQPQSGSFSTGTNVTAHDVTFYAVFKELKYTQTNASAPALATNTPYRFGAFVESPCQFSVTNATLRLPTGTVISLDPDEDSSEWEYRGDFSSQAAMDAAFTNGNYVLTIYTVHEGVRVVTNLLTGDVYPGSTPHVSSFNAAQAVDPSKNFKLTWDVFTGGAVTDFVQVNIEGDMGGGGWFDTPEPGAPGALNGTNTSASVPAGTLAASQTNEGTLLFAKLTAIYTNSYPGVFGLSAYARETQFPLVTIQPAVTLSEPQRISASQFRFRLTGTAGQNYTIQYSTTLTNWSTLYVTNAPANSFIVIDSNAPVGRRYYRALIGP